MTTLCYPPGVSQLPRYPEPELAWPGYALSICQHNEIYASCVTCQQVQRNWGDRRDAWADLQAILLSLKWLFSTATIKQHS